MDINLSLASPNKTATWATGNETTAECLCTIYTTAKECDQKTATCVYEWFLVLIALLTVLFVVVYVAQIVCRALERVDAISRLVERLNRRQNFHAH